MRFSNQDIDNPDINLAPLIDVVFLILIFFVISTTFVKEQHLAVSLPETTESESSPAPPLTVTVDVAGVIYHAGIPIKDIDELLNRRRHSERLLIRAAADARHASVTYVLDAAKRAGFRDVAIATVGESQ